MTPTGHSSVGFGSGFDVRPARPAIVTAVLFAGVVLAASGFAHLFRESAHHIVDWYAGSPDPTEASRRQPAIVVGALTSASVLIAAVVGRVVQRRLADRVGIDAVAASARGEPRPISVRATAARVVVTWGMSLGLASVGRESAIVEAGGALGSVSARRTGGRGDAMATAGITAAFASAYHAPVAAVLYVEEHLGVRGSRRAITFALLGAAGGHAASVVLFGGTKVFPGVQGSMWEMLRLGLLALLPAVLAARLFLQIRVRVTDGRIARSSGWRQRLVVLGLSVAAGATVATWPDASGNGMEALRTASVTATVGLGVALLVGKLIGTAAVFAAGAPGGAITPTMCIAAGSALLTLTAWEHVGVVVEHPWDAIVAAMAVGVAVGMRSPLTAVFLIPELLGDYRLLPVTAIVVGVALIVDRGVDLVVARSGLRVPTGIYDEDA